MKYAVIALNGSQYQVHEGDIITTNPIDQKSTDQVLLINNEGQVKIGTPTIKDASVEFEIVKTYQDQKIRVYKYKAKSRYHKTQGHRSQLVDIKILKINGSH